MTGNRGLFIVLEGLDRTGKSTQVANLVTSLVRTGKNAKACRFPDRTTTTGQMIDSYLTRSAELDDHAVHLLFSANRWERASGILKDLQEGTSVVSDRYAFSGIAFSAIKGLSYNWCLTPDQGLPSPDLVIYLTLPSSILSTRPNFGAERYETEEIQNSVKDMFERVGRHFKDTGGSWVEVDAEGTVEEVAERVLKEVEKIGQVHQLVGKLWDEEK